jgi:hypothetical protein
VTLLQSELLDITTNVSHAFGWFDLGVSAAALARLLPEW